MDSHDTARTLWTVNGDESALRLCTLFQMTMPGAPCIYYGDEIGMTGATDPFSRAAFPWDDKASGISRCSTFFQRAIALRHQHPVLRTGSFRRRSTPTRMSLPLSAAWVTRWQSSPSIAGRRRRT
jgi:cyclomaltodextrinase